MKKKVYFKAVEWSKWTGIMFEWQDWSQIYFAWWNEEKPKFIIQSLYELYWEEGIEIYKKFMNGLLNVNNIDLWYSFPTAALVLYKKEKGYDKDSKEQSWQEDVEEIYDKE